jgi:hypothetical protein
MIGNVPWAWVLVGSNPLLAGEELRLLFPSADDEEVDVLEMVGMRWMDVCLCMRKGY